MTSDDDPRGNDDASWAGEDDGQLGANGPDRTTSADQTERVILRAAAEALAAGSETGGSEAATRSPAHATLVIDDATGELVRGALPGGMLGRTGPVIALCSSRRGARELAESLSAEIREGLVQVLGAADSAQPPSLTEAIMQAEAPVDLVLLRLPKALAALDALAREVAAAAPGAVLVGGARIKHMTRSQNEVLERSFTQVRASRGIGKSRALVASAPREIPAVEAAMTLQAGNARIPVAGREERIELRGAGGVFGGASADAGSLLLLSALDAALRAQEAPALEAGLPSSLPAGPADGHGPDRTDVSDAGALSPCVMDLGCGNGLLVTWAARALPGARVIATDDDADAVRSTLATLAANGILAVGAAGVGPVDPSLDVLPRPAPVAVSWDDAAGEVPTGTVDAVLLNPPFHDGAAIDATLVHAMLDAAARVLRPGGELWFVHNSHLRYRTEVERRVGPAEQRARDRRFTVLRAVRD